MFEGRKLLIATKHEKQKVIAPILETELGVKCFIVDNFDTDELGTFSGEIERKDDAITTARKKCLKAIELTNCDLVIASEGSFGPHPSYYFIPADEEVLLFYDKKNDLEIIVKEISTNTNFNGKEIKTEKELLDFAHLIKFPSHGLIIKNNQENFTEHVKGIIEHEALIATFNHFISKYGKAFVETDMRALYNPTRMKVIEEAAIKLVNKINTLCPKCNTPGFSITDAKYGLPCSNCNFPTKSILNYLHTCKKCSYSQTEKFPHGKFTEEPMYCGICNP